MARLGNGQITEGRMDPATRIRDCTTKQLIDFIEEKAQQWRTQHDGSPAGDEYAKMADALEQAKMRLNRGHAMRNGVFNEADLEHPTGQQRARDNFEADHGTVRH